MTDAESLAFYTAVFAADAGTDALYSDERETTEDMAHMCIAVAKEAIRRSEATEEDFYTLVFVEAAGWALKQCHEATLEQLFEAGQRWSDVTAGIVARKSSEGET
jgi:hypothetical protein